MNTKKFSTIILIPALIIILCEISQAATYYVSPSGSAAWSSCINISTPCSRQTAMANALAGDLVYFRGGTYDLGTFDNDDTSLVGNTRMYPANSGEAGSPITFIAYPGEIPNITGTVTSTSQEAWFGCGQGDETKNTRRNYITWDGFSATMKVNTGSTSFETALFRVAGDHCIIRNSNFTGIDVGNWAYNTAFVRVEAATNAVIENNYFHDLISLSYDAVNTASVYFNSLSNLTTVRNNTVENCEGGIYGKGNSANVSIYNNFIYNSANNGLYGVWYKRSNFLGEASTTRRVYQNVIVGYSPAIWFENGGVTVMGSLIYNNTIYASNGTNDGIDIQTDHTNTQVFNNIISNNNPFLRYYDGTVSYSNYNAFYRAAGNIWNRNFTTDYTTLTSWTAATGFDSNSINSNPLFVNAGGSNPEDYRLQSSSPAISAGIDRQDYDADGNVTESIDMGAYPRKLGDRVGYRSPQRPAAPGNLQ